MGWSLPCFPKSPAKPRVNDCRILSSMLFMKRGGLHWCDAPKVRGAAKTLHNLWKR